MTQKLMKLTRTRRRYPALRMSQKQHENDAYVLRTWRMCDRLLYMKILSNGKFVKVKVAKSATKRDAYFLNGIEITKVEASVLCLSLSDNFLSALRMRDCTSPDSPVQTSQGLYWHTLELL